jgi:hypothetical protein
MCKPLGASDQFTTFLKMKNIVRKMEKTQFHHILNVKMFFWFVYVHHLLVD